MSSIYCSRCDMWSSSGLCRCAAVQKGILVGVEFEPIKQDNLQAYRNHWRELHTQKAPYVEWLLDWIARIPPGCGCGESFESILQRIPPRFDDWFAWTVDVHNAVNRKLSKTEITLTEAIELWQHVK